MLRTVKTVLTVEEKEQLEHLTKHAEHWRERQRAQTILWLANGDAVELPPAIESASTRQMVDRLIAQFDLKVSVGSDFHGSHMPWIKLGNIPRVKEGQVGIWESFK